MSARNALGLAVATALASSAGAQTATVSGSVRIANAAPKHTVVYLEPRNGAPLSSSSPDSFVVDQYELQFVPPVLVVTPGTVVLFRNSDPIMHNVFSPPGPGPGFNLGTYPTTEARPHIFRETGTHIILCHVHPEMAAFIVVLETPYYAIVDDAGRFTLPEVPSGRYALRTWHLGRAAAEVEIDLRPGERRTLEIDIPPRSRGARP